MDVNGQLQIPASLSPRKEPVVLIRMGDRLANRVGLEMVSKGIILAPPRSQRPVAQLTACLWNELVCGRNLSPSFWDYY
jgi:hypothetical protein